ncbi:metal ABC transporter permease [Candidatus Nomurabacteria bacterium]|nr:metal ABC transporter permease [Candidatus Nomurabacteria bacterium]
MNLFQYTFILHGLSAGIIVAVIAPMVGIFLVLKRYSLIADTLAHVSLAGIAIGLLAGINPVFTALGATVLGSLGVERLRMSKNVYGESALALFLSGSLALAIVLISLARGFNTNLFNYLFGSIVTVTIGDVYTILCLAFVVIAILAFFYREIIYVTFDEDAAQVSGVNTRRINTILIVLAALVVSLSIPIVGVLLIGALIVIPVVSALQLRKNFMKTILYAEIISIFSVIIGIIASFYLNISAGGAIVLLMLAIFFGIYILKKR